MPTELHAGVIRHGLTLGAVDHLVVVDPTTWRPGYTGRSLCGLRKLKVRQGALALPQRRSAYCQRCIASLDKRWRPCSACGARCYWHDTHWVCEVKGCGSEWNADHDILFSAPGDLIEEET